MVITFRTYCGEAGSLDELLIGTSPSGINISRLYYRASFPLFFMRRAKKKILKEFEILTGKKCIEGVK